MTLKGLPVMEDDLVPLKKKYGSERIVEQIRQGIVFNRVGPRAIFDALPCDECKGIKGMVCIA